MIGSKIISYTGKDFARGESFFTYIPDGGLFQDPEGTGYNLSGQPGVIYSTETPTTITTTGLTGVPVASVADEIEGTARVILTDNGQFATWDGSTFTVRTADSTYTFATGVSDIIQYKGYTYATATTQFIKISKTTNPFDTKDDNWWTATMGKSSPSATSPHPMLVYEDMLWIADGNKLHRFDGTTASEGFLTLPSGQVIVAMNIDPSSGKMLISVVSTTDYTTLISTVPKILTYDGFSNKVTRAIIVDAPVTAIYALGGYVYMIYGTNLGYWNGSGISFLRQFAQNFSAYKHEISNAGNVLLISGGSFFNSGILAYGEVVPGTKTFWTVSTYASHCIFVYGTNSSINYYLGICGISSTATFKTQGILSSTKGSGTLTFSTRMELLVKKIQIRHVCFDYATKVTTGQTPATITVKTQAGTYNMSPLTNGQTGDVYSLSCDPVMDIPVTNFIKIIHTGTAGIDPGIRGITITYDEWE